MVLKLKEIPIVEDYYSDEKQLTLILLDELYESTIIEISEDASSDEFEQQFSILYQKIMDNWIK